MMDYILALYTKRNPFYTKLLLFLSGYFMPATVVNPGNIVNMYLLLTIITYVVFLS